MAQQGFLIWGGGFWENRFWEVLFLEMGNAGIKCMYTFNKSPRHIFGSRENLHGESKAWAIFGGMGYESRAQERGQKISSFGQ